MLFCAKDVTEALGYSNTRDAVNRHCRGVVKHDIIDSLGRKQETNFIPESDLYRLVFSSKLPQAERFTDWVTEEVLPTIRKHGAYMTDAKLEEALLNPDTLIRLATDLKAEWFFMPKSLEFAFCTFGLTPTGFSEMFEILRKREINRRKIVQP